MAADLRSVGTQTDDATITAKVKMALIKDPVTKARKIDVDTVNEIVTLTGMVKNEEQRRWVLEIVRTTEGVKEVIDNLVVKGD